MRIMVAIFIAGSLAGCAKESKEETNAETNAPNKDAKPSRHTMEVARKRAARVKAAAVSAHRDQAGAAPSSSCDGLLGTWRHADSDLTVSISKKDAADFSVTLRRPGSVSQTDLGCQDGGLDAGEGWIKPGEGGITFGAIVLEKAP